MARPSKYNEETVVKANEYLDNCYDELPTVEGLSLYLDVGKRTIYDWASDPEKDLFSHTLEKIKNSQAQMLIQKSLKGDYNAAIAKLMLHNHDYSDKQHTQLSGVDGKPIEIDTRLQIEIVDAEDSSSS